MILWTIKLLGTIKKAIAGRKYPHQLAWAAAFGLLLGIVPPGNLLAVGLLVVVLSLKINHAMAGLTAIAASFLVASHLDPIAHIIGDLVLTDPRLSPIAVSAWQLPLVPWTDLNNTVVMGSFLVGTAAIVPVFVLTYPLFLLLAPTADVAGEDSQDAIVLSPGADARKHHQSIHQVVMVDRGHDRVAAPHAAETAADQNVNPETGIDQQDTQESENRIAVETRIDVIRMGDDRPQDSVNETTDSSGKKKTTEQPMDEALNYLLRQLRDSQHRSAA